MKKQPDIIELIATTESERVRVHSYRAYGDMQPVDSPEEWQNIYERICSVVGVKTQLGLAEAIGIKQSSISDAKRRCSIPSSWKMILLEMYSINPEWIMDDTALQYMYPSSQAKKMPELKVTPVPAIIAEEDQTSSTPVLEMSVEIIKALKKFTSMEALLAELIKGHVIQWK